MRVWITFGSAITINGLFTSGCMTAFLVVFLQHGCRSRRRFRHDKNIRKRETRKKSALLNQHSDIGSDSVAKKRRLIDARVVKIFEFKVTEKTFSLKWFSGQSELLHSSVTYINKRKKNYNAIYVKSASPVRMRLAKVRRTIKSFPRKRSEAKETHLLKW